MGQAGINAVMPKAVQSSLRQSLKVQLEEYESICATAKNMGKFMGMDVTKSSKALERLSSMAARTQLISGNPDSKIAGMMIQGNTRGMIQCLKDTHRAKKADQEVLGLAQRLLETQTNNIQQMEGFL